MPRYTIDLSDEFDALLSKLANEKSSTKSEIIRKAVASYAFLDEQVKSSGKSTEKKKVSITNDADKVIKDVLLP